ncbi:hypothetical protein BD310DRAFT_916182 [Dichomitus squalens]|uniref:Uncharacterized protein n=1 Tax=Dichomitus squalens TaxID=114155 RepID=A0A4Q9Q7I6_9APHY|nr:hypothetical protein BD310DRAFT_916182 [Dichomitus squalens]
MWSPSGRYGLSWFVASLVCRRQGENATSIDSFFSSTFHLLLYTSLLFAIVHPYHQYGYQKPPRTTPPGMKCKLGRKPGQQLLDANSTMTPGNRPSAPRSDRTNTFLRRRPVIGYLGS